MKKTKRLTEDDHEKVIIETALNEIKSIETISGKYEDDQILGFEIK